MGRVRAGACVWMWWWAAQSTRVHVYVEVWYGMQVPVA